MKRKVALLALVFVISSLFSSICYAYIIDKKWQDTNMKYYTMNSSFAAESKDAFSLANSAWNNVSGAPFSICRLTTDNSATSLNQNFENEVFKASMGTNYGMMDTTTYYYNGEVFEFDICVNTSYTWANNGDSSAFDVQNIATHEIGHALFSADLYGSTDTEKTMYGYAAKGETKKRTLHSDDISGFAASNN